VRLTRRRNEEPQDQFADEADERAEPGAGKGRPTPKRRDAVGKRGPVTAPKTRKEAYKRQKELAKVQRTAQRTPATQLTVAQRRELMRQGDPSVLPRRDQGKSRQLARDWVDSHRMVSNYLLILFPLIAIGYFIPVLQIAVLVVFFGLLAEWFVVGTKIRKLAIERFGSAEGGAMSLGFYAGSRAYMPRRWRLPAPRVERGDEI
jgi:Protein of unknown function (DUF3043)